jgi:hypothetical protein
MNRRGFLTSILKAGVAAMVLPSAVTYARQWKKTDNGIVYGPLNWNKDTIIEQPYYPLMVSYDIVTHPELGITMEYRKFHDPRTEGKTFEVITPYIGGVAENSSHVKSLTFLE